MEENKLPTASNHFFKILMPGFHKKLNLPPAFCTKLKQGNSGWAMLKSRKGTSKIKVGRNREGIISFEGAGWPQFVVHHSLSIGDFVVFKHVGRLNFNVFVFDPSACEKEFLVESNENGADHEEAAKPSRPKKSKREAETKPTVISYNSRNPYFVTTVKPSHENYPDFCIPMGFARLNNLQGKTSATLRVGHGRSWTLAVIVRKSHPFRLSLGAGWRDFYKSNELKVGDVCVFHLNPGPPTSKTILFDVKIRHSV